MKIKFFLPLLFLLAFSSIVFAQSVVITPKKTTYRRKPNPDFKEKQTFTVTYPTVSGAIPAATKKKLENTISYWRVFETTLAQATEDYWLTEAYYRVNYNKNGIFDISLTQEGVGAYSGSQTINLVIDLKAGEQIKFADAIYTDDKLVRLVNQKLEAEKREIIKAIENNQNITDQQVLFAKEEVGNLTFTTESFNEYSVSDNGVTILYDAGFPHAYEELEPAGRYFFTWAEIKAFIKPAGLLGRFVR